ncbi:hypothetical protein SEA_SIXAMA_119 [Gordonia phage Sixama]|uniref:Uncharacterized protein n=1 Tax=Gordonia phage Sixama TaxID=2653271 RepID=A0A5Q2F201_9CAUD|nr:hypothetical protein PP302_gp119 [Gordonia phage Sixama]QGF20298.1 hypothetical protein SEA_SIXAMA_119 [Gordonia phage Sixama]
MPAKKERIPELSFEEIAAVSSTCTKFVEHFSAADAARIVQSGWHVRERPRMSDPFVDCLAVAVAYDCLTEYHGVHGFERPSDEYLTWIKSNVLFEEYISKSKDETIPNSLLDGYKKKFESLGLYR